MASDAHNGALGTFLYNDIPGSAEFFSDLEFVVQAVNSGPGKTLSFRRLRLLENRFEQHVLHSNSSEVAEQKAVPHRDFYNTYKNDGHVHHSSSMNLKHLLRFIKKKLKRNGKDVVIFRDGKHLSLEEVFASLNLSAHDLSINTLDMHAHQDSFHRFDTFNNNFNPIGESRLREIFLKTDNLIRGKYLAELTQEIIRDLEVSKYLTAEYRISVYGRSPDEWSKLAAWVVDNGLFSNSVRWIIQIPRLYHAYRAKDSIDSFQTFIRNVFGPLFAVTKDPSIDPKLHLFLERVVGFDTVDDESLLETQVGLNPIAPVKWTASENPPYSYYVYYIWVNLAHLNRFRKDRLFVTFPLRLHSGEAGDPNHLCSAFLTALSVCHGVGLRKVPALQYLFYLMQIGISMSPISNNVLFLTYDRNPFPTYFRRGLNVSLSTDDPLQFHFTREPLIEEYSIAAQIWKLSPADLAEICRNGVMQSGFELAIKKKWLGSKCMLLGAEGNDISKTNIPQIRLRFREQSIRAERALVLSLGNSPAGDYLCEEAQQAAVGNASPSSIDDSLLSSRTSLLLRGDVDDYDFPECDE